MLILKGVNMRIETRQRDPTWYHEARWLMTVGDAAEVLQVHPNTIYNWIHSGKLWAFKLGRAWRIPKEGLLCLSE